MNYNLVYMARPIYGGWVTFTAHLSLKFNFPIYKIFDSKQSKNTRKFGYNTIYTNLSINEIVKLDNIIITALDKHYWKYLEYFPEGTIIVIHDPGELKMNMNLNPLIKDKLLQKFKIITIRKTVQEYLLNNHSIKSNFLLHPFYEYDKNNIESMNNYAVSISRIDYDKNTDIILRANKIIEDEDKKIKLFGAENRFYVFKKLEGLELDKYWYGRFKKNLPMIYKDKDILKKCKFVIDLSTIKNDGGGTQYTFLEAIYNDCILILHNDWINKDNIFKNNYNCLSVSNENELKNILESDGTYDNIIKNSKEILKNNINVDWNNIIF